MFIPVHDQNPLKIIPFQRVTLGIIAVCVAAFLWQQLLSTAQTPSLIDTFGLVPAMLGNEVPLSPENGIIPPELTVLTAAFLHGGWMHLIGNMLFLWVFGDNVEDSMGHLRFLVFYLLCATAASLAHVIAAPDSTQPLVGASGAVAGILGAYLVLHPRVKVLVLVLRRVPLVLPAYLLIGVWLLIQLFNLWSGGSMPVAWWAHVGGFVTGVILILPFRYKQVPLFGRGSPR